MRLMVQAASRQEAARLEKERKFLKEMCDALVDNQKQYTERSDAGRYSGE